MEQRQTTYIEELYRQHYDTLLASARMLLGNDAEAYDAVSDVFADLLTHHTLLNKEHALAFLQTSVRNRCRNILNHRQVKVRTADSLRKESTLLAGENEEPMPGIDEVNHFVDGHLTPQTQTVMRLRYEEGKTYNEIASELGISRIAVYKHLSRAIHKLRLHFSPVAVAIVLFLLVGIAYAAIRIARHYHKPDIPMEQPAVIPADSSTARTLPLAPQTITFEDTPLEEILGEMGRYYGLSVVYRSDHARHLRLHFVWNQSQTASDMAALFNHFGNIRITIDASNIIVE